MSDTQNRPEAASEKRRAQARERQRKRGDLNLHYMEEEALRALDAGSLRELAVDLMFPVSHLINDVTDWLGIDSTSAVNQAIHFAAKLIADDIATIEDLERLVAVNTSKSTLTSINGSFIFKPTPTTVRTILRSGHRDALYIYVNIGIFILFESLSFGRLNPEASIKTLSWHRV